MQQTQTISDIFQRRQQGFLGLMANRARSFERQLKTSEVALALAALDADQDNFLLALNQVYDAQPNLALLAKLIGRLEKYMDIRGLWEPLLDYALTLIAKYQLAETPFPIGLLSAVGNAYDSLGDYEKAVSFHEMVIPSLENSDDTDTALVTFYHNLGNVYRKMEDLEKAQLYLEKAVGLERQRNDKVGEAQSLMNLSEVYYERWEMRRALELARQAVDLIQQTDNLHLQAQMSATLAMTMVANLQFDDAAPVYEVAMEKLGQIGDRIYLAEVQFNYALLCRILKQYPLGQQLAEQSLVIFEQAGMKTETAKARKLLRDYISKGG